MASLSIRWRIMLWNTVAFAIILVAFGLLVYGLLRQTHYAQIDRTLRGRIATLDESAAADVPRGEQVAAWLRRLERSSGTMAVVFDAQGGVVARDSRLPAGVLSRIEAHGRSEPFVRSATLPQVGHQRLMLERLHAGGDAYTVLLMAPLEHVDEEMHHVLAALAVTIPATLIAAAVLAYALARKALNPVERLCQLTNRITAQALDQRLPVANSRDELGLLAATINEMIGRLERSFAEIRRFTADASHELRTPITVIRAEVEEALDQMPPDSPYRPLLRSVIEECDRLTRTTDQLLALSREDAAVAVAARAPVNLGALLQNTVESARPLAAARSHALSADIEPDLCVWADACRLEQVLLNLLDNAIKYTPPDGTIVATARRQGREAVVTIEDSGPGIPADHLPHVFRRFYRVEPSRSRAVGGAGLGLSIVHSIVTAHGGTVDLDSGPGRGTTVRVRLPLVARPLADQSLAADSAC